MSDLVEAVLVMFGIIGAGTITVLLIALTVDVVIRVFDKMSGIK